MSSVLDVPWDMVIKWKEDDLQMAVSETLRRMETEVGGFTFAADQNAGRRSWKMGAKLKAMGMRAGEVDLRIYAADGEMVHIELKTNKGSLSASQRDRHELLRGLGHEIYVVKAGTPAEAVESVLNILLPVLDKSVIKVGDAHLGARMSVKRRGL